MQDKQQILTQQQRQEKAKDNMNRVLNVIETQGNDQEIEQILQKILYGEYEIDDVLVQILASLKSEYHDQQKELEKLRDKAQNLNEEASSL